MRKQFLALLVAFVAAGATLPASCDPDYVGVPEVAVSFNNLAGENPESIAFDSQGNMVITMALAGELRKVAPDGTQSTLAVLPVGPFDLMTLSGFIGALAIDTNDDIFVNLSSGNPADRGVWHVDPSGNVDQLAVVPLSTAPNGIALLGDRLFMADSTDGKIWSMPKAGGDLELWADDPLLKPIPNFPVPGPNGIQYFEGAFYVAISATGRVVKIEVQTDGTAGAITEHATVLQGCDDFAFDTDGAMYCTTDLFQTVLKILPDGTSEILLDGDDGLDGPTATVFGRGSFEEHRTLYITNAAFPFPVPPGFPPPTGHGASVLKVELGMYGVPRYLLSN